MKIPDYCGVITSHQEDRKGRRSFEVYQYYMEVFIAFRMSEKGGDLYDVEVSHWEEMALYHYDNKPVSYYH